MIDWTKPIETVDGRKAKVLTTEYYYRHSYKDKIYVTALISVRNLIGSNKECVPLDDLMVYDLSTGEPACSFYPEIRNKITKVSAWMVVPNGDNYIIVARNESAIIRLQEKYELSTCLGNQSQEVTIEFIGDAPKGF